MLPNEELYNEFKRLQSENYYLKNQIANKTRELKKNNITIRALIKKIKYLGPKKRQYFKNGKRGTFKNGG